MAIASSSSPSASTAPAASAATFFGAVLVRFIVPLWVLAGALFKLYERDPKNLPSIIIATAKKLDVDLDILLRALIGCELFAVGVMFFVPRLARSMATFMLVCFCVILLGEMYRQATSCGCFGSIKLKPWQMLAIDGTLLAGVFVFAYRWGARKPVLATAGPLNLGKVAAASLIATVSMIVAFGVPRRASIEYVVTNPTPTTTAPADQTSDSADASTMPDQSTTQAVQPAPAPTSPPAVVVRQLPSSWYAQNLDAWVGKPWREIDLFQLMDVPPRDMDKGKRYIVFYSRTCEHCLAMLEEFTRPLDGLVTLVEVPATRTVLTDPGAWDMPLTVEPILQPEMLALPLGPSWLIQTPLVVRVENGTVTCAQEGDHKKCMGME